MSLLFNGGLLDEYALTKEKFETAVGLGKTKSQIRLIFCLPILRYAGENTFGLDVIDYLSQPDNAKHVDYVLDKWCLENYGIPYNSVYEIIQETIVTHFEDMMSELGVRGNPSAIAIANEVIRKKESSPIAQVVFVNQLPNADDDKDDE